MLNSINKKLQYSLIFTILLILVTSCTQNSKQQNATDLNHQEVTIFNTEKRMLHSEIVNDDFELYISLPNSYAKTDTNNPVLFNLDANLCFGITDNVVYILSTLNK